MKSFHGNSPKLSLRRSFWTDLEAGKSQPMHFVTGKYRVVAIVTRVVGLFVAVAAITALQWGCSGFAEQARADEEERADGYEVAADLYASMVVVFQEDTEGIDAASPEHFTVISVYEVVGAERRRRFVGRVVPVGGGIGVQITAEYQTEQKGEGDRTEWIDEPRELVEAEASPDELRIARRVERVYNRGEF